MSLPLIGLTTSRSEPKTKVPYMYVGQAYVQAVQNAGAIPVMIPLGLSEAALLQLVETLDGVIFTGGGDMLPERYGSTMHPKVGGVDPDRDRVELFLYQEVMRRGLPFLGICRGFQVFNVALGGTLYEDILDQHTGAIKHDYYPDIPRDTLAHTVEIKPGARLAKILGLERVEVNSLHHQGARSVAPGLVASAFAPDGIVEGLELPDYPFGLAVQWHPEWLQAHAPMRTLFRALTEAAQAAKK